MTALVLIGADVFDGTRLHRATALTVEAGRVASIGPPGEGEVVRLDGGILAPGLLDLQVNGSGGVAVDGATDVEALRIICAAQARLGATSVLPTLITDAPAATTRVLEAGIEAAHRQVPGFMGLHLEGPHLDPRRQGAHDAGLIRPMEPADLDALVRAARDLPVLMVTVAPEAVTDAQIARLAAAGVVVSLGHSDCTMAVAQRGMEAGATCVTHLFNAMSQLGHREPGLVGAALAGQGFAGLIADGIHVAPAVLRIALAAKPDGVFLVSDCMAVAGTTLTEHHVGGRRILRRNGRLTLDDGTLAGADLTLTAAIRLLVTDVALPVGRALSMVTSIPARAVRQDHLRGHLLPGRSADIVHLRPDWTLGTAWQAGRVV